MSLKYALTCACSQVAPVEVGQAGGTVSCTACGAVLEVPKLRELRQLSELQSSDAPPRASWSPVQGSLFVSGLLAIVIAAGAALYTSNYRMKYDATRPDPSSFRFQYDLQDIPLIDSWQLWKKFETMKIESRPTPYHVLARQKVQQLDRWLTIYAALAVAGVLCMLGCILTRPGR